MNLQNESLLLMTASILYFIDIYEAKTGRRRHLSEPPSEAYERGHAPEIKYPELELMDIADTYVTGTVWPKPQHETRGKELYTFDPNKFKFKATKAKNSILSAAFSRYKKNVFPDSDAKASGKHKLVKFLKVEMKEKNSKMDIDSDESCK